MDEFLAFIDRLFNKHKGASRFVLFSMVGIAIYVTYMFFPAVKDIHPAAQAAFFTGVFGLPALGFKFYNDRNMRD